MNNYQETQHASGASILTVGLGTRDNMPERIQRRRTKGWVMPPNTVYVGRGSIFGNPYISGKDGTAEECVERYRLYLDYTITKRKAVELLSGHNLMCWCKIGDPCHADVLLEVSNVKVRGAHE